MSGGGATKANEEYFTAHPWSGDNGSHDDWEKVLTLKAFNGHNGDVQTRRRGVWGG